MNDRERQASSGIEECMSSVHYDVVIVGGGLVGLSAALALSCLAQKDHARQLSVAVVEAFAISKDSYIADDDPRTTALSYGTRLIYESLGIWDALRSYAHPIRNIHVSDRGLPGMTRLSARECTVPSLGYVVPNKQLLHVLTQAVEGLSEVTIHRPANVETLEITPEKSLMTLSCDGQSLLLSSDLVVLADGGRSSLMKQLGFAPDVTQYGHTGILATITHSKQHGSMAFERFTDEGPMAMLPIASDDGHKSAMIWTMPAELAGERLQLTDEGFLDELHQRFGYRLGAFEKVGKRLHFPLTLKVVPEPARQGAVLLGNSAHSLHPVAGQGYNLALRDTMVLSALLTESSPECFLGSPALLQDYLQRQRSDQLSAITFSDRLVNMFSSNHPADQSGRTLGLVLLDGLLPAKQWFGHKAMGLGGYGQ